MGAWEERSGDDFRSLVFVGVDGEARDAAVLERFQRDLSGDAVYEGEDPKTARYRGGAGARSGYGIVGAAFSVTALVEGTFAASIPLGILGTVGLCASLGALLWMRATKPRAPAPAKFELTFTPTVFRIGSPDSVTSTEYPLEDVQSFEGTARLFLIRSSEGRIPLRPTLPRRVDTEQLAARLNEILMEARRWSGAYRG